MARSALAHGQLDLAALQAFDEEDFHELSQVPLGDQFAFRPFARVVRQRAVAGVEEIRRKQLDGPVKGAVLVFVKFVEQGFGVGDIGEFEGLGLEVRGVLLGDLGAGAPNHPVIEAVPFIVANAQAGSRESPRYHATKAVKGSSIRPREPGGPKWILPAGAASGPAARSTRN